MQIKDKLIFTVTRLLRYISSIKLALIILVTTVVLLTVGVNPWYNFNAAFFRSWLFTLVLAVLLINLVFCTYKQAKRIFAKPVVKPVLREIGAITSDTGFSQAVRGCLVNAGFHLTVDNPQEIMGYKGRVGVWGPVIFHLGLILICIGIFLQIVFSFSGRIGLVPGQVFTDLQQNYLSSDYGLWRNNGESRFKLVLHEVKSKFKDDGIYATGDISVIKGGEEVARQDVNAGNPLGLGIWGFYKDEFGYYVKIRIITEDKDIPFDVGLSTFRHENSETYRDIFDNPDVPYKMSIEFIPDIDSVRGKKSYKPNHPAVRLMVQNRAAQNGKVMFNDLVRIGQTAAIDKNTYVKFEGYFPWLTLFFKIEPGIYLINLGFGVCLGGLVLLNLLVPQYIRIKLVTGAEGSRLFIGGWTSRYQNSFQHRLTQIKSDLSQLFSEEEN